MFSVSHSPKAVINFVLELEHCYSDAFISKARFKVYWFNLLNYTGDHTGIRNLWHKKDNSQSKSDVW